MSIGLESYGAYSSARVSIHVTRPVRRLHLVVHVRRPARPVAAAAVPQADEAHLVHAAGERGVEQPEIAAFVGVAGSEFGGGSPSSSGRDADAVAASLALAVEIALAPCRRRSAATDFWMKSGSRNGCSQLHFHAALLAGLGEQQVATAGALGEGEVVRAGAELVQRLGDLLRGDGFLRRRESAAWRDPAHRSCGR